MLPEYAVLLLVMLSVVSCQIDGEFWWLKNDVTKLKHGTASPPQFDDVNELDTDETAKVVFRDSDVKMGKYLKNNKESMSVIHFRDETELAKPNLEFNHINVNNKLWEGPLQETPAKTNQSLQKTEDEFKFVFPGDDSLLWADNKKDNNNNNVTENKLYSDSKTSSVIKKVPNYGVSAVDKNPLLPENICTFIKKSECIRDEGNVYEPWLKPNTKLSVHNTQTVCCILPVTTTSIAQIIFPDNYWSGKRHKRSNADNGNSALNQRNTLMSRRYPPNNQNVRVTTPLTHKKINQKFVNSDEYSIDPYWNIKNSNIRSHNTPTYQDPDTGDYGSQSYGDDYADELPKPGLIGLYSDHKQTQSTWLNNKNKGFLYDTPDSVEEEEFETSFGYSTIDPRQDHRKASRPSNPFRQRPLKLTASSTRVPEDNVQSPVITFHSNPDFQVLQGFKLLNLVRNNNRFIRKTSETDNQTVDNGLIKQEIPSKVINNSDDYNDNEFITPILKQKLFDECGKTQANYKNCENGPGNGLVEFGGHPWIALVVLTKSEYNILCYATIVHSRVAVSIADCVNGKSPGAVSIIAGLQNLKEELAGSQRRMTTITIDSDYTPGNLEHNLALLHWIRPLKFDARVQPACLGDPHTDNSCVFVGWGGYDQEMHSDLRWQPVSIVAPQNCVKQLSKAKLGASDAFCAVVKSRGTVTGVGGPLLCKNNGRWSAVGVAVWRNDVIILLPHREWVIKNMFSLRI